MDHDEVAIQRQANGEEDVELVDELLQGVEDAPDDGVDLVVTGSRPQQCREAEEQLKGRARAGGLGLVSFHFQANVGF